MYKRQRHDNAYYASVECYEKAIELNEQNFSAKVNLAACYTDGMGDIMTGVLLLREVAEEDVENIEANMKLAEFSMMSRQFEKAIQRLEVVLGKDSLNLPALFLMADAWLGIGETEKGIEMLKTASGVTTDSVEIENIDLIIQNISNGLLSLFEIFDNEAFVLGGSMSSEPFDLIELIQIDIKNRYKFPSRTFPEVFIASQGEFL